MYREYCETNLILQTDTDFEKGIELLKETYYKKNDVFILKMKTAADVFRGKSYSELQTWFFKYRQSAKNCGLTTMTEEEQYNFKLLTTLSEVLDHEDLKDDNNKGVIRIIDDIAGYSKDLPTFKRMCTECVQNVYR